MHHALGKPGASGGLPCDPVTRTIFKMGRVWSAIMAVSTKLETIRNQRSVVMNVPGHASVEVSIDALQPDIVRRLTIHGLAQKLGDAAAKERDPITGKSASAAVKYGSIRRIADALLAGEWTVRAERLPADAITDERVAAVAAARKMEESIVRKWLVGLPEATRAAAFAHPSVAVEIARMRAERAAAGADPDADPFEGLDETTVTEDDNADV